MPKYIDFDALGVQSCNPDVFVNKGYAEGWNSLIKILHDAPAADVEPKQKWIPVTERLPENSDDVIIYLDKGIRGEVTIGFNAGDHKWYIDIGYEAENTVTHWMPLPEPPGEADDGHMDV